MYGGSYCGALYYAGFVFAGDLPPPPVPPAPTPLTPPTPGIGGGGPPPGRRINPAVPRTPRIHPLIPPVVPTERNRQPVDQWIAQKEKLIQKEVDAINAENEEIARVIAFWLIHRD